MGRAVFTGEDDGRRVRMETKDEQAGSGEENWEGQGGGILRRRGATDRLYRNTAGRGSILKTQSQDMGKEEARETD